MSYFDSLHLNLIKHGYKLVHTGKVRNTYALPDGSDDLLLVIATNRVSIFDFVLRDEIPTKGQVLTAMTVFWLKEVLSIEHHLIACGKGIDLYLPKELQKRSDLQRIALVVKKLSMYPIECIVRGYLTGSGWKSYKQTGKLAACSIDLPEGLHDGSRITASFNPTTKEDRGHDLPMDDTEAVKTYGQWIQDESEAIYRAMATYAEDRRLIMADTKLEYGTDGISNILADEIGTPDSSRFWRQDDWEKACESRRSPQPYDKQLVRNWGISQGIDGLDPCNSDDVEKVSKLKMPMDVIIDTRDRYYAVFNQLVGYSLSDFQTKKMGIS